VKRLDLPAWMVGSTLAVLVAAASWLGFPLGESRALDLMFVHGRSEPPPASSDIVLALVDDQAIETVGSWPWPRETLADCLTVLDRFGARVIAIDIVFNESSPQDAALADAIANASARVILAVDPTNADDRLGPEWQGREGLQRWHEVLAVLEDDVTQSALQVANRLALEDDRAARVRQKIGAYKRIVIRRKALELRSKGRLSEAALKAALIPADTLKDLGRFPEAPLIAAEVERAKAAEVLERDLPDAEPGVPYATADGLLPPILALARHADGPGVVKATPDEGDGHMRRATLRWNVGGKVYPQLGAAAAAHYRGAGVTKFASPQVAFSGPGGTVVLEDETILLSWPAIDRARGAMVFETCSLGVVVGFIEREKRLATLLDEQRARTRQLLDEFLKDVEAGDFETEEQLWAEVRDACSFQTEEVEGAGEEESAADRRKIVEMRNWLLTDREITELRVQLASDRAQLRIRLRDRLVFVGWSAWGNVGDFFPTAVHPRTPGVVAHAVIANSLLTPYVVRPAPSWIGGLIALCLGLLSTVIARGAGPRFAFLFATLLAVLYVAFDILLVFNTWNIALAIVGPVVGVYAASAGTTTMRAIQERREKAQLERQFGARISPQLFDFLVNNPDLVHLEGEEREVTCFFSDLAGFTSISEQLDSRATVKLLNRYMYEMNAELTKHSAYVNKFLGDGIMAIWGAFELGAPHAERACLAALDCRKKLAELNAGEDLAGLPKLSMRIGIATGVVTIGDCGAPPDLRDYTVIGDTANLAARLESANKQFGTRILVNGRTKELLPAYVLTRPLGVVTVVGQKTPTEIHDIVSIAGEATDEEKRRIERTTQAVEAYRAADFEKAVDLWRELRKDPESEILAELYLAQLAAFAAGPTEGFDGVLHLTKK